MTGPPGLLLAAFSKFLAYKENHERIFVLIDCDQNHPGSYGDLLLIGLLSFLLLDYSARYADPAVAIALRQTNHPLVTAGPLFQVLRGFLFGMAFHAIRQIIFPIQRGWLTLWLLLLIVGIFSPFSSAPGSIEGIVYSTFPMWFHIISLPELIIQSFLLASLTYYWVNRPEQRWLSISFGTLFVVIVLLALMGIISALGFLSAPA